MLPVLTLGQVRTIQDAAKCFNDIQTWALQLQLLFAALNEPPGTGDITFLVMEDGGTVQQWTLVAGAGVTLNVDPVTQTVEITSP